MRVSSDDEAYLIAKGAPQLADKVEPEHWFLWQAFWHLRGSRGMGGPIPFSEIAKYGDWAGVTCPVQKAWLVRAVLHLDDLERTHGRTSP